jgi:hypothetical protein
MKASDSGKVTKNCYLENIIKSINSNLRWLDEHPQIDKVVMLEAVNAHIRRKIAELSEVEA